jgi:hypothetical protein
MTSIDEKTRSTALLISSVLFRSFFLGIGIVIIAAIAFIACLDQAFAVYSEFLDSPRLNFELMIVGGLIQMRILLLTFFLIPAIAIRWALKKFPSSDVAGNQ